METETYVKECRRTEAGVTGELNLDHDKVRLLHTVLGIATEAGEVVDVLKKEIFYHREFDKEHFLKELGDVLWYVAMAADILGVKLEDVMNMNIAKLRARYPEKFSCELANNRKEGDI